VYPSRRRVLIVSDQEADREVIRLLLGSMGCRWILASSTEEALAILNREPIAAAIVDARLAVGDSKKSNAHLREILLWLPGRVIQLSESDANRMVEFADIYSLPSIKRDRWAQELWGSLEALLWLPEVARLSKETARLAVDTFTEPLPEGIRQSRPNSRHLLYETSALSMDIFLERALDSDAILLAGQILTRCSPQGPSHGTRVALLAEDRLLGLATTNQTGEFVFEFEKEPKVILEIEDRPSHCVRIHAPDLSSWWRRGKARRARVRGGDKPDPKAGASAARSRIGIGEQQEPSFSALWAETRGQSDAQNHKK
jgi:hypothetical protein